MFTRNAPNIYHYVDSRDPLSTDAPPYLPFLWLNSLTGKLWSCLRQDNGVAVWADDLEMQTLLANDTNFGHTILAMPLGLSTTDMYKNYSNSGATAVNTGVTINTTNYLHYNRSASYDSGDNLEITGGDFALGTGDFTIETHFRLTASTTFPYLFRALYNTQTTSFGIRFGDAGFGSRLQVSLDTSTLNEVWNIDVTMSGALNNWHHIAFVRESGTCRVYMDGTRRNVAQGTGSSYVASFTSTVDVQSIDNVYVGHNTFTGQLQNTRVTKGLCRYTGETYTSPGDRWL